LLKFVYLIMAASPIIHVNISKVNDAELSAVKDALAVEEPLEIRIEYGPENDRKTKNVSVTMRTPGNDGELALGFLFTEGVIKNHDDIIQIQHSFIACAENKENTIVIKLKADIEPNLRNAERNFYTTSSCGVCGKGSISAIKTVSAFQQTACDRFAISSDMLYELPELLKKNQATFADTGGIHAAALFNKNGDLLLLREDVGRHNALDKLIGAALKLYNLPFDECVLLLSGRASFELVQKAAMCGIKIIVAVGAPSSLAVETASEFNITLAGFLRGRRFNIYTAAHRIAIPVHENTY
jgi:FdhD protein